MNGIEIDVIDVADPACGRCRHRWLSHFGADSARVDSADLTDAASVVTQIGRAARLHQIGTLRIWSDRPPGTSDPLSPSRALARASKQLGILHALFAHGAHAELRGYGFGLRASQRQIVQSLARTWGVPVQAGPVQRTTGAWRGLVIQAMPDGVLLLVPGFQIWGRA